jgi:hypothetical protein
MARQAARWSTAADQDKNPMIALLHANYGAGYLWAMQDIATSSEIEKATGMDWKQFRAAILAAQDNATRRLASLCPGFSPQQTYLTRIARER